MVLINYRFKDVNMARIAFTIKFLLFVFYCQSQNIIISSNNSLSNSNVGLGFETKRLEIQLLKSTFSYLARNEFNSGYGVSADINILSKEKLSFGFQASVISLGYKLPNAFTSFPLIPFENKLEADFVKSVGLFTEFHLLKSKNGFHILKSKFLFGYSAIKRSFVSRPQNGLPYSNSKNLNQPLLSISLSYALNLNPILNAKSDTQSLNGLSFALRTDLFSTAFEASITKNLGGSVLQYGLNYTIINYLFPSEIANKPTGFPIGLQLGLYKHGIINNFKTGLELGAVNNGTTKRANDVYYKFSSWINLGIYKNLKNTNFEIGVLAGVRYFRNELVNLNGLPKKDGYWRQNGFLPQVGVKLCYNLLK